MEEEEISRKTRKHRKRKIIKQTPPVTDDDSLTDNICEGKVEEEKVPKKRGRKPKEKEPATFSAKSPEALTELQQVYRIVEQLMTTVLAGPFLDRPDEKMNGMSDYYEIITNPMWFNEIKRKYENEEYTSATEVTVDLRLMLENCYLYWGPNDALTKKGVQLEQRFEQKLSKLSEETQKLCSLVTTHGAEVEVDTEDDSSEKPNPSTSHRGYSSRLLRWSILKRGRLGGARPVGAREASVKSQHADKGKLEQELLLWETEHLISEDIIEQISSMPEFPEIGQFLHLVHKVLNIEPVSHIELERMLLMPQASTTLATVFTSMLIPPLARVKLEGGPAMPYSIWTSKLNTKVAQWYKLYHSKGRNTLEVFEVIGIDPQFWQVMGDKNPLTDNQFHQLSLLQKVWLLKGLCDFIFHNHKLILECVSNLETEELRQMNIGRDNEGYSYHYFPMFSDIRIYRMAKIPESKWKAFESGVQIAMTMLSEDDDEDKKDNNTMGFIRRKLHKRPKCIKKQYYDFKMVADSLEGIRCLVDELCDTDLQVHVLKTNAALVANLNSIISQLEPMESKILSSVYNVRNKMRQEWLDYTSRKEDYVDPGLAYWQSREKAERFDEKSSDLLFELHDDDKIETGESSERPEDEKRDCRERRSKRESQLKLMASNDGAQEDSESEEEFGDFFDDDSSDEWHAPGSKPKKNKRPPRKPKKAVDLPEKEDKNKDPVQIKEEFDLLKKLPNINVTNSSKLVKQSSNNINDNTPVTIKKEAPDPDDKIDTFSQKNITIPNKKHHQSTTPQKQNLVITPIKNINSSLEQNSKQKLSNSDVIQTLVPYSKESTSKVDVSNVKRSISPKPDPDIVYISDSEEPDVKPTKEQLLKAGNVKTLTYSMNKNNSGNFIRNQVPVNVSGNSVYNVQPNSFISQQNTVIPVQTQQIAYAIPNQPIIQPQTVLQMQNPSTGISPNQKFVVIQQPGNNILSPTNITGLPSTGNNVFPSSPRMQTVNWYGPRNNSPISTSQNPLRMSSPRQRGQNYNVVQARSPQISTRGRGGIRSPGTPTRMPRFSARTPNSNPQMNIRSPKSGVRVPGIGPRTPMIGVRTPGSSTVGVRTPIMGQRTPTGIIRTTSTVGRGGIRTGAIRNLFDQTPPKNQSGLPNSFPDIEGELIVGETDNGGFGYFVKLADGGKISLTSEQLAQIRSDNGGTLPKRCKVPLKQNK